MERIALFAGSFDPLTTGHEAIVRRALPLFDHIVVAIGTNTQKHCMFPLPQRLEWLRRTFADAPCVTAASYDGLTTDFCHAHGIHYLLRGLRGQADFLYEENITRINRSVAPDIETLFLLCDDAYGAVSSTMLRELLSFGHSVAAYVPVAIRADFATLSPSSQKPSPSNQKLSPSSQPLPPGDSTIATPQP